VLATVLISVHASRVRSSTVDRDRGTWPAIQIRTHTQTHGATEFVDVSSRRHDNQPADRRSASEAWESTSSQSSISLLMYHMISCSLITITIRPTIATDSRRSVAVFACYLLQPRFIIEFKIAAKCRKLFCENYIFISSFCLRLFRYFAVAYLAVSSAQVESMEKLILSASREANTRTPVWDERGNRRRLKVDRQLWKAGWKW